jgi:glycerophosphoryl diester phosphodiesterase
MSDWLNPSRPLSIAHRGASAYAPDCSLEAYETAARLSADMWEVDIRRAACGMLITSHDDRLPNGEKLAELTGTEIVDLAKAQDVPAVPFETVAQLALHHDAGIYADIKDLEAAVPTMHLLQRMGLERAILGGFSRQVAKVLAEENCPYPRATLVPIDADPFEFAQDADVIHLCWEAMENPEEALTPAFFAKAQEREQKVVLWHEEDPACMAVLRDLPVLGICSDRPELVKPFTPAPDWPVEIVCHRGACEVAPENTLSAFHCALAAGFDYVEIDVRETSDGALVVFHDDGLWRTSSGRGAVSWHSLEQLQSFNAGRDHTSVFAQEPIPTLQETLATVKRYDGQLYVEIKSATPAKVLDEVRTADMLENCFFWSFEIAYLRELSRLCPEARLMVRRQDLPSLQEVLDWQPYVVEFDLMNDDLAEIQDCQAAGVRAMVAYSGRDPQHFATIAQHRPDMVNLHQPFRFRDFYKMTFFPND